jgi:tRNA pseudouridine32 synthase/23S rRNA pseudouridine746 synthase
MDATVASRLQLPPGRWPTLLDGLCARFPAIAREVWLDRFARGRVTDAEGVALPADAAYRPGLELRYFREVVDEPVIPGDELVLHVDAHLVVVDKPHFLPVTPSGAFVRECLLRRLVARLGQADLAPLHRIDRDTAGLVLFSANAGTRDAYQRLFRERSIRKVYEAVAPAVPNTAFPQVRATRLQRGEPFFRMAEVAGEANSETRIAVLERAAMWWRYALTPITGRKHQLRVHMAAIGAPLRNDRWYPEVCAEAADDYSRPLQLLARSLDFVDPLSGATRRFTSARELLPLA